MTVSVQATGLEPGKFHQQHIHGFANPHLMPSQLPTLANSDVNGNGMVDDLEREAKIGPPMLYLTKTPDIKTQSTFSDFPVASAGGKESFTNTYDVSEILSFLTPLNIRGIELHGMTEQGVYVPEMPVAAGLFVQVSKPGGSGSGTGSGMGGLTGGSGGSGGANAVPRPAAAWPGLLTLAAMDVVAASKSRRQGA